MEDVWQPLEVTDELAREMREDSVTWSLVIDRLTEADELWAIGEKIGKRPDLEPEFFPERKSPNIVEICNLWLKQKFGRDYRSLGGQLAMAAASIYQSKV